MLTLLKNWFRAPIDLDQEDRYQQLFRDLETFRMTGDLQRFLDAYGVSPYLPHYVIAREVGIGQQHHPNAY